MRSLLREMYGDLTPWGKFWLTLGLVTLACAALMSFDFGYSISIKHALFLMCLSAVAAFGPDAAREQWHAGRRGVAAAIGLLCVPLLGLEFYTHAGYTAGLRGQNIETATVQNTRYAGRQDEIAEAKTSLVMWEKRLAELEAQNAWAASVTAEALRAQLASSNLAIEQETARGGCKAKCLARTKDRDDLATRIAIAEERGNLAAKIEATKKVVATARDKAAVTEFKSSAVGHQNEFLSKVVALVGTGSLRPTEFMSASADQSVNLGMALGGTGLPALALLIAGLYRRRQPREDEADTRQPLAITPASSSAQPRQEFRTVTMRQLRSLAA